MIHARGDNAGRCEAYGRTAMNTSIIRRAICAVMIVGLSGSMVACQSSTASATRDDSSQPTTQPAVVETSEAESKAAKVKAEEAKAPEAQPAPAEAKPAAPETKPTAAEAKPAEAKPAEAAPATKPVVVPAQPSLKPIVKSLPAPAPKPAETERAGAKPATQPAGASRAPAPTSAPSTRPAQMAWVPAPKLDRDGKISEGFLRQHESFLKRAEREVGLLLLGDSITRGWDKAPDEYKRVFGPYNPANFGIGGDRTEHVLWRIENGELDKIRPKVVMLMIGTNNIGNKAEDITRGVTAVVDAIKAKLPQTKILLLGIFPRGDDPAKPAVASGRKKIDGVNANLAKLADGKQVRYLDIGHVFLDEKGVIPKEIMPDALHPTPAGYKRWADAVKPVIDEMMKD